MIKTAVVASLLAVGLLLAGASRAASVPVETALLIASDGTGKLSNDQLRGLANQGQATLERVLAFWSADAGVARLGKVRVIFDAPRRDVYSSVFYWEQNDGQRVRVVRVFSAEGAPQMMAHKLTSAVFPQKDKLIRNLMGILTEAQVGNPMTFPMCGFDSDDWALAFVDAKSYIPLAKLGPDHESWGMKDAGGGKLSITDKARQHRAYAETGSFGNFLYRTYGVNRIKQLQRLSADRERPVKEAFGADLKDLEASWLQALRSSTSSRESKVAIVSKLFDRNPDTACAEAQRLATTGR